MKKLTEPKAPLAPVPNVLVTLGDMEKSNIIAIGWTGVICSVPPRVYISVRPSRYSYGLLSETKEFAINLVPKSMAEISDWCGSHSGRDCDKFAETELTKTKADKISCPLIEECPVNVECKVFQTVDLGSHRMFMADVVAFHADEKYLSGGEVKFSEMDLTCYLPGDSFASVSGLIKRDR